MPQVTIKGISEDKIQKVSRDLYQELARAVECPVEWFVIDAVPSVCFSQAGEVTSTPPIVNICWFPRPASVCEKAAGAVARVFETAGVNDITVFFTEMMKEKYFHFEG